MEVSRLGTCGDECDCVACGGTRQESLPGLAPEPTPVQQQLPGIPRVPGAISFRALGKEVLKDGVHYADATDEDAANCIVHAMNAETAQADWAYLLSQAR